MRRSQRLIATAVLIASPARWPAVGGMGNFDPSDMLDFLDTKKKLPGERKPVFPDGVPGLEQGVPKDLYKGARQQQLDDQNAQAAAAAAAPPPAEPQVEKSQGQVGTPGGCRAAPAAEPPRRPIPMPRPTRRAHRRSPPSRSRRGSRASAPPRRRPISRRSRAAQPPQQSAAPFPAPMPSGSSRANFFFTFD